MSATQIAALLEKRKDAVARSTFVVNAANKETRSLTPAEDVVYHNADRDIELIDQQLDQVTKRMQANDKADTTFTALGTTSPEAEAAASTRWLPTMQEYRQALQERAVGTTGALIPVAYSDRFFDQLRKRVGVLAAGPDVIPVVGAGSIKIPLGTTSVTVGATAEGVAISPTDPGFSSITLDPRKLAAMTLVNREAIEDSSPQIRDRVSNALVKDMAVELDRQFVVGDGTGQNMTGLLTQSGVTAGPTAATNGTSVGSTAGYNFLADTLAAYEQANLDPDKAAWLMHARTWASIRKAVDSQSRPIFNVDPSGTMKLTLFGKPVYFSNNIPITQTFGTANNASSLLLADFSQVVVAEARGLELMISEDYAFNTDQIAVRATCRYDIGLPQPTAVVKTTGLLP
jgi:HK97 family phage major capsid protein